MVNAIERSLGDIAGRLEMAGFPDAAEAVVGAMHDLMQNPIMPHEIPLDPVYHHPHFDYDFTTGVIRTNGDEATLTGTQNHLFELLSRNPNKVLTQEQMQKHVLGIEKPERKFSGYKTLVFQIREKLKQIGVDPRVVVFSTGEHGYYIRDNNLLSKAREADTSRKPDRMITHKDFTFYPDLKLIKFGEEDETSLTSMESRILEILMNNRGVLTSTSQLYLSAWPPSEFPEGGNPEILKTHVSRIRSKLRGFVEIKVKPDSGYIFNDEQNNDNPKNDKPKEFDNQLEFIIGGSTENPEFFLKHKPNQRVFDTFTFDPDNSYISTESRDIKLSPIEADLLRRLTEITGYTIPTQMLMNQVNISITNLRKSLAGLRQKINASGSKVKIHSVNNGYILLNT